MDLESRELLNEARTDINERLREIADALNTLNGLIQEVVNAAAEAIARADEEASKQGH
jgi:hypothetical protein